MDHRPGEHIVVVDMLYSLRDLIDENIFWRRRLPRYGLGVLFET